jgi:hypothetical protein
LHLIVLATSVATLFVVLVPGASSTARPARPGGKLVPASGAFFGTTVDGLTSGPGGGLQTLEKSIGRKFDVVDTYYGWQDPFPTQTERNMVANHRIPMISWKGVALQPIIDGQYDNMIRARANHLRNFKHWVFLRWGWEMNGNWEDWSGANNMPNGPAKFVQAWRHIRQIFWNQNAWNVVFIWSPNDGNLPRKNWNSFKNYYPGDKYVDWVGVDGFNWGTSHSWSEWLSIDGILSGVYSTYHSRKPIMIAETGSVEQGGNKAKWIRHVGRVIRTRFPAVAGVIYFNGTTRDNADFRVSTSSSAMAAYRAVAHDPFWNPPHP